MDDDDLAALRAKRLAELRGASGGSGGAAPKLPPGFSTAKSGDDEEKRSQDEARRAMLSQILDPQARERLGRVAIAKPDKAAALESHLLNLARSGQLRGRVSEKDLIGMLEGMSGGAEEKKIVYARRRADDSDDELELDL
ncbi:PDCD5-related protein [Hyaloraphidium curvatum]|nr:PDCD5-related protein [Hyaloraphidium curvatum]